MGLVKVLGLGLGLRVEGRHASKSKNGSLYGDVIGIYRDVWR